MGQGTRQKNKLLYLQKILLSETDENHGLTGPEIISKLSAYGIAAERKTIYDDIAALIDSGLDICIERSGHSNVYYVGSRLFQEEELYVLADAVSSSRFLTKKKSDELIKKLQQLTSRYHAQHLRRTVYVGSRTKTFNEKIYYTTDCIHQAMSSNHQISFKYFEYDLSKKQRFRHGGREYVVSPYYLIWESDCYYLVCYCGYHEKICRYRVDRMADTKMLDIKRRELTKDEERQAKEIRSSFNMYGGTETDIVLRMSNQLINVIIDRFGEDVHPKQVSDDSFEVRVKVQISPTFWGWLFQFGDDAKVVYPDWVVAEAKKELRKIEKVYNEDL